MGAGTAILLGRKRYGLLAGVVEGGIYVSGSGTLVWAMLRDGLVDELYLFVYPVTLGAGQRLFADTAGFIKFKLAACESFDNGALHLRYRPATPDH